MANAVETFRGISILIFKWLLFSVVGIVGIAVAVMASVFTYNYLTYDRHAANVQILVTPHKPNTGAACADTPEYPLFIGIINKSSKTIDQVTFSLEARRKGYSTNLATYESHTQDKILKPGEGWGQCWRPPLKSEVKDDPRDLEWKATDVRITFE